MTLVLDSNIALEACAGPGFDGFNEPLVAPPLMWSEFRSGLHEALWRGEVTVAEAETIRRRLRGSPIRMRSHRRLDAEAWRIAEDLGWAKTYEAEYVALARLTGARLLTLDARLRRGAARLGFVIGPTEI